MSFGDSMPLHHRAGHQLPYQSLRQLPKVAGLSKMKNLKKNKLNMENLSWKKLDLHLE